MKSLIVSQIFASHGAADGFNKQLAAVVEQRAAIMQKLETEAKAEYLKLGRSYTYEVKDATIESLLPASTIAKTPIRVLRRWTNKAQHDYVRKLFGVAYRDEETTTLSKLYYRINGVLVAEGAGEAILKSNVPCTDEEWTGILAGKIPVKFVA